MAFNDREISTQDGRPVTLYLLEWGKTRWRYTSADRAITRQELVDGKQVAVTYEPRAISDNGMRQGGSAQNDFQMSIPANLPIVALYQGTPPSEGVTLTVRRVHYDTLDDAPIYWIGDVTNVKRNSAAKASIVGKPITASLKRTGLRLCWTRECPHFTYDDQCRAKLSDHAHKAVILAGGGGNVLYANIATARPDNYLRGGFLTYQASAEGTIERRAVEEQVLETLADKSTRTRLVVFGTLSVPAGTPISLYPSCDRTPATCGPIFNNQDNYGGWTEMPGDTPFGRAIF